MPDEKKLTIITFTDPMMGFSYECEPIFRKLETRFGEKIRFKYLMCVLVKNFYDFVNPGDLSLGKEIAIKNYNARLAKIYESEEGIGDLPIDMSDFKLFSVEHTSSLPLNLAYKAAQIVDEKKADLLLYNLRYATIAKCRPTTRLEEILKVVRQTGIDEEKFLKNFNDGTAQSELEVDLKFAQRVFVRTLPAYLIEYDGEGVLIQDLIGCDVFEDIIKKLTGGKIKPEPPEKSPDALRKLLKAHPLISPQEICAAFDLKNLEEVEEFISPLIAGKEIFKEKLRRGYFIRLPE